MSRNRVDVGRERLEAAFRQHKNAARACMQTNSQYLLFIYSLECGLNALLMKIRCVFHTSKLAPEDECGHDLDRLVNLLRKEAGIRGDIPSSTATHPNGETIHPIRYHSFFRYGGCLEARDLAKLSLAIDSMISEIEERL